MVSLETLKTELLGRDFPERVEISEDQIVIDVQTFLRIQFLVAEAWKKDLEKCPSYLRLLKFREAVQQ